MRIGGLVFLPERAVVEGGMIHLDGKQYMVGPAIYEVRPTQQKFETALGPEFDAAAEVSYEPVYLSYEDWPTGMALDNAVAVDLSEVIPTKEVN